jgi:hypothetical protein
MTMKLSKGKLYKITWLDIQLDSAWTELSTFKRPEDKVCVWYYIGKQDEYEVFSSGGDSTQHFDVIHVPKGCITKIVEIQVSP